MISMCSFRSSMRHPELAGDFRHLMVLQQAQVIGDDLFGRRPVEPEVPQLQQQALLQVARGDAGRIEALNQLQRALDLADRPRPHRRQLVERRHQIPVVVEVADDRARRCRAAPSPRSASTAATSGDRRASWRSRACSRSAAAPSLPAAPWDGSRRRDSRRRNIRSPGRPRCRSCSAAARARTFRASARLRRAAVPRSAPLPASGSRPSPD